MASGKGDVDIKMEVTSGAASPLHPSNVKPSLSDQILPTSELFDSAELSSKSGIKGARKDSLASISARSPANSSQVGSTTPLHNAADTSDRQTDPYADFTDDDIVMTMADRIKRTKRLTEKPPSERSTSVDRRIAGTKKIKGSDTPLEDQVDLITVHDGGDTAADVLRRAVKVEESQGLKNSPGSSKSTTPPVTLADMLVGGSSKLAKSKPTHKASPDIDGGEVKAHFLGSLNGKSKASKKSGTGPGKKGTARSVTAPKKPVKTKGGTSKVTSSGPHSPGSETSDDGGTYCICHGPDDHRWMIACDTCDNWFHGDCVGISPINQSVVDKYVCPSCETQTSYTTYVPFCRLESCNKPSKIHENPPSDYCSKEHQMQYLTRLVKRMRHDDHPSFGGDLNASEVSGLVMAYDGDFDKWSGMFERPTLSKDSEFAWETVFNDEEKMIMDRTNQKVSELEQRISDLRDQTKLVQMIITRAEEANEGREKKRRVCGFDPKLTFTLDEFLKWKASPEGRQVWEAGKIIASERKQPADAARYLESDYFAVDEEDPKIRGMCIRAPERDCKRHFGWQLLQMEIQKGDIKNARRAIRTIKERQVDIQEAAEEREALRAETEKTHWCEDIDPEWREKLRRKLERVQGLKDPRYGIPVGREHEYAGGI